MYEIDVQIGVALDLEHRHIHASNKTIEIELRDGTTKQVQASPELMELYYRYVVDELLEVISADDVTDRVFLNLWSGNIGEPMTRMSVTHLLARLEAKTGISASPNSFHISRATPQKNR